VLAALVAVHSFSARELLQQGPLPPHSIEFGTAMLQLEPLQERMI
jgi:hypothetical protein